LTIEVLSSTMFNSFLINENFRKLLALAIVP
jgi:hypothetical protein